MESPQPLFPLELFDEPDVPGDLDQAIRRLLCECFPDDVAVYANSRAWHSSVPTWSIVHRRGQRVAGHVSIFVRTVTCGQVPVTVAGVGNYCVASPWRGTGLARCLMDRALEEALRRQIRFGLLFCVPDLAPLYGRLGWVRTEAPITMVDESGVQMPIPAKNLGMYRELTDQAFPPGPIHLRGRDW